MLILRDEDFVAWLHVQTLCQDGSSLRRVAREGNLVRLRAYEGCRLEADLLLPVLEDLAIFVGIHRHEAPVLVKRLDDNFRSRPERPRVEIRETFFQHELAADLGPVAVVVQARLRGVCGDFL